MSIDFEKVLKEKLHEDAFAFITSSEKEFADWIERVRWQSKRCDELAWELKRIKDKEEQGLLIELPCKVGDTVYELLITGVKNHEPVYEIYEAKVIRLIRDSFYWCCETITKDKNELEYEFVVDSFGKTVFLTRSEAEEALAKMGGK